MTEALNEDHSPCLACEHHMDDKRRCSRICLQRIAYSEGKPWKQLPLPTNQEIGREIDTEDEKMIDFATKEEELSRMLAHPPKVLKPVLKKRGRPSKKKADTTQKKSLKKESLKAITPEPSSQKISVPTENTEEAYPAKIKLSLSKYPAIENYIYAETHRLQLPLRHIVVQLLAEGIASRKVGG